MWIEGAVAAPHRRCALSDCQARKSALGYRDGLETFPHVLPAWGHDVAAALTKSGYAVIEAALPFACWRELRSEAERLLDEHAFTDAHIGHGSQNRKEILVRGDSSCWLNQDMPAGGSYLRWMEELRVVLNRELFLGMTAFEAHYAHFPVGAFYGSHLDRYGNSNARVLSAVFYCNHDWPADAGGEFVMYDADDTACLTLAPRGGTLILFLSAGTRHEAKVSSRARWSIAGWFRAAV